MAKAPLPSKTEILNYWWPNLHKYSKYASDYGEPFCWACGEYWNGRHDNKPDPWEAAPLERCHIIPESMGGTAEPSNLFLLCAECHCLSPDTTDKEIFFKWVLNQDWGKKQNMIIKYTFESFGVDLDSINPAYAEILSKRIKNPLFKKKLKDTTGQHAGEKPISSYIGTLLSFDEKPFLSLHVKIPGGSSAGDFPFHSPKSTSYLHA